MHSNRLRANGEVIDLHKHINIKWNDLSKGGSIEFNLDMNEVKKTEDIIGDLYFINNQYK